MDLDNISTNGTDVLATCITGDNILTKGLSPFEIEGTKINNEI